MANYQVAVELKDGGKKTVAMKTVTERGAQVAFWRLRGEDSWKSAQLEVSTDAGWAPVGSPMAFN